MTAFRSLSAAIFKGYIRDKMSVFFSIAFPLMFLVLFGGIFSDAGLSKIELVQVGDVTLIDDLPAGAREAFDEAFDVTVTDDLGKAVQEVEDGDVDLLVYQDGDTLKARYSQADQVTSAVALGTLQSFVQTANVSATGRPPTFTLDASRVEDDSLETIQFFTPSLLGWAVATSATFGAAATLVAWRSSKLLRRLRLSPVTTQALVGARIGVTVAIAMGQLAIFVGLGVAAFGLQLTGSWWMSIPLLIAGTLAFMSIGLLAGSVSKTVEGATGLANFVVLPMAFLSGSFFPLDGAPGWLQAVSSVLPLKHLNDGMLDVMVRGQGPGAALAPIGILLAFTAALIAISSRLFSWESE